MEIVKKNLLSIVCGVVALLAVIALFYPLGGTTTNLQDQLQTRASVYQSLESLQMKSRTLPIIDPTNPHPVPLKRFPNEALIKQAEAIPAAFAKQAQTIEATARKMNEHQILVPGSLPYPSSSTTAFEFRDEYRDMMANGIAEMLHAGHPPTPDEIQAAKNQLWNDQYKSQLVYPGGVTTGNAINQEQVQAAFTDASAKVEGQERLRVANTCKIYMDPTTALSLSPATTLSLTNTSGAGAPSPSDIWYAQLGLWIQQDVAQAINRTNADFKNVIQAPVKRLMKIDVSAQPYVLPTGYQPNTAIQGDPKAPVSLEIAASPTGRVCNPMYDVVHFQVVVDVEADKIPSFLDELSNGQFITVLQSDVHTV
ncbi:MAG TPA: hypothetical protein VG722_11240, partial [Tepidisphaeraceae bacterium]|nr:hypothetical protein [Tepidisphaeraceae bacterium]